MKINGLRRRLERLETAAGVVGSFEKRVGRLATALGLDPVRVVALAKGHKADLSPFIDDDGRITWPAFCELRQILAEAGR